MNRNLNLCLFIYFFITRVSLPPSDELIWVSVDGKTLCWLNQYKWSKIAKWVMYMTRLGLIMLFTVWDREWEKKHSQRFLASGRGSDSNTGIAQCIFLLSAEQIPICLAAAEPSCKILWYLLTFLFLPSPHLRLPPLLPSSVSSFVSDHTHMAWVT